MNCDTKMTELPALTLDFLNAKGLLIDNVFANLWKETGMKIPIKPRLCIFAPINPARTGVIQSDLQHLLGIVQAQVIVILFLLIQCAAGQSPKRVNQRCLATL